MRTNLRYSLRSLLLAVTFVAVALWWKGRPARVADALVHRIEHSQIDQVVELFARDYDAATVTSVLEDGYADMVYDVRQSPQDWWLNRVQIDFCVHEAAGVAGRRCEFELTVTPDGVELVRFVDYVSNRFRAKTPRPASEIDLLDR